MKTITSSQRKQLTKASQSLNPIVQIGQNGVTDAVLAKIEASLASHELLKVKYLEFKDEKQDLSEQIAVQCNAVLVRIIGNIALFYRPAEKEEDRAYGIIPQEN
ncbi:MAG: YhbY family RNA-binding protein [Treponema sp.]|nr:YhbY family RNA-binding protein [Treponema sp.]